MNKDGSDLLSDVCAWIVGFVCTLFLSVGAVNAEQESDNAAPLYYQAFLLTPYLDIEEQEFVNAMRQSRKNVAVLRKYTEKYQYTIQLLEDASRLPHCNWAVRSSPGDLSSEVRLRLTTRFRNVAELIRAHAYVLAADGDYRAAFSKCLMVRRMAWHVGDDPPFHFEPGLLLGYRSITSRDIRKILEIMPPDEKILRWLSEQLAEESRISDVALIRLKQSYEVWLREDAPVVIPDIRRKLAEKAADETQKQKALALTDEAILKQVREPFEKFHQFVADTLNNNMSYEQKVDRYESLITEYEAQTNKGNPVMIPSMLSFPSGVPAVYNYVAYDDRLCNAYEAAVKIYLLRAPTGRLPQKLPDRLPKDPITGENFKYKVTDDGFVLGHQYMHAGVTYEEFRFKVSQQR